MTRHHLQASLVLAAATLTAPLWCPPATAADGARVITPTFQPLLTSRAKSGVAVARKPAAAPHRPGPIVDLRATRATDGRFEWRCDGNDDIQINKPSSPETETSE